MPVGNEYTGANHADEHTSEKRKEEGQSDALSGLRLDLAANWFG